MVVRLQYGNRGRWYVSTRYETVLSQDPLSRPGIYLDLDRKRGWHPSRAYEIEELELTYGEQGRMVAHHGSFDYARPVEVGIVSDIESLRGCWDVVEELKAAAAQSHNLEAAAVHWLHTPSTSFDGVRPVDLTDLADHEDLILDAWRTSRDKTERFYW